MAYKQVEEYKETKATQLLSTLNMTNNVSKQSTTDIEDCDLCFSSVWDPSLGVCNYPTKPKKKEAKQEMFGACLIQRNSTDNESYFMIVQRPESGLLAGLWEFPNIELNSETKQHKTTVSQFLCDEIGTSISDNLQELGEVVHKFSHRHHTYKIYHCIHVCQQDIQLTHTLLDKQPVRWISKEEFKDVAVSTGMRKVFKVYEDRFLTTNAPASKKRKFNTSKTMKNQKTMESFFQKK